MASSTLVAALSMSHGGQDISVCSPSRWHYTGSLTVGLAVTTSTPDDPFEGAIVGRYEGLLPAIIFQA